MHMYVKKNPQANITAVLSCFTLGIILLQCVLELQTVWHSTDTRVVQYPTLVGHALQDTWEKRATAMDHALVKCYYNMCGYFDV